MSDFEQLVAPHVEYVHKLAMRLTQGADHGRDVAQNALVRAFRLWHTYVEGSPMRPWLVRITVREFLRDKRYKKPRAKAMSCVTEVIAELYLHGSEHALPRGYGLGAVSGDTAEHRGADEVAGRGLSYTKKYLEDELTARVRNPFGTLPTWTEPPDHGGEDLSPEMQIALARLRPEQREVIRLFAEAGPSYDDLAEELGIDRETFKSRLRHARDRLRSDPALVALVAGFRCRASDRIRSCKPVDRPVLVLADVDEGHAGAAHLDESPADPAAAGPGDADEVGVPHRLLREGAGDRGDELGGRAVVPDEPRAPLFLRNSCGSAGGDVAGAAGANAPQLLLEG